MTYVWVGMFALCIVLSLYPSVVTRALIPIALIVGFGIPFNFRFPDFYLRRLGLLIRMSQLFSGPGSTKKDRDGAQEMQRRDNDQVTKERVQITKPVP
jgi:hypothetical protein